MNGASCDNSNILDETRKMSVSSFLSGCGTFKLQLKNDFGDRIARELKDYLGTAGEVLLGENIRNVSIKPEQVLNIGDTQITFSELINRFGNADQNCLFSVIAMASEEFTGAMGNYSLDQVSRDLEYAQEIASIALIFQIVGYYPLRNNVDEVKDTTKDDANTVIEKKSYADMTIDELDERFEFLTVERRGRALQACVDKGWITEKDARTIVIHADEGYISIGLLDIEMDDSPEKLTFAETLSDDSPNDADWIRVSRLFLPEIEKLRREMKEYSMFNSQEDSKRSKLERRIRELEEQRGLIMRFFVRNVLNMRQDEYLITFRGSTYTDSVTGSTKIYGPTYVDKKKTLCFRKGMSFADHGEMRVKQGSFFEGLDSFPIIEGGKSLPIRRVRKAV